MKEQAMAALRRLVGGGGSTAARKTTTEDEAALYESHPSLLEYIPWVEFDPEREIFLFDDGLSVGAVMEAVAVDAEARPEEFLERLRDQFRVAMHGIPELDENPWVLQCYVQDEPLKTLMRKIRGYVPDRLRGTPYTERVMDMLESHLERVTRPSGLFEDRSGSAWRGKVRRVRFCLYRRLRERRKQSRRPKGGDRWPSTELEKVLEGFRHALDKAGVAVVPYGGKELYEWIMPWLAPRPATSGGDPWALMEQRPYPVQDEVEGELPYSFDLAAFCLPEPIRSAEPETGIWWLGDVPSRFIPLQGLPQAPKLGHFTIGEEEGGARGESKAALLDRMPEGSVLAMTVVFRPQDEVETHMDRVRTASVGKAAGTSQGRQDADDAAILMTHGCRLYWTSIGVYVRGEDRPDLERRTAEVISLLRASGLDPLDATRTKDPLAQNAFVRNLPMCYDANASDVVHRSHLNWTHHMAAMLPLFGRGRGTGTPGLLWFNRTAEPVLFDPLSKRDRTRAAHMNFFGPTGSGKSASAVYINTLTTAIHLPRWFILEAGNSFGLWADDCRRHGLSVHHVRLMPGEDVSLNPFAEAIKLAREEAAVLDEVADDDDEGDEGRDLIGEMEIAGRMMITGGEAKEEAEFGRADRMMLRDAILRAARKVYANEGDAGEVIPADVRAQLEEMSRDKDRPEERRVRASRMADAMGLFCSGAAGEFFNRRGKPWPDADVTLIDLGLFARKGYEDSMTVAVIGLINHINSLVERHQHDQRQTIIEIDEAHNITKEVLLMAYLVKVAKMWRKLGCWLWQLTQNLDDYPDEAEKMLSMAEFWFLLSMEIDEIAKVKRFKRLTAAEEALVASARKEPGRYVEGVILSPRVSTLVRSVVPPLCLALAQTEKHEKAERRALMEQYGLKEELDAAYLVAEQITRMQFGETGEDLVA